MENTVMSNDVNTLEKENANAVSRIVELLKFLFKSFVNLCLIFLFLITFFFALVFVDDRINKMRGADKPPLVSAYVIVSPSMTPTIRVQDAVIVFRTSKLKEGDIITFKSSDPRYSGYTITHRIVNIVPSSNGKVMYVTKGDNNFVADSAPVYPEDVYGKVSLKIPYLGFLQTILFQPSGLFLIILIPSLVLVIHGIFAGIKVIRENSIPEESLEFSVDNDSDLGIIDDKTKEEVEIL